MKNFFCRYIKNIIILIGACIYTIAGMVESEVEKVRLRRLDTIRLVLKRVRSKLKHTTWPLFFKKREFVVHASPLCVRLHGHCCHRGRLLLLYGSLMSIHLNNTCSINQNNKKIKRKLFDNYYMFKSLMQKIINLLTMRWCI